MVRQTWLQRAKQACNSSSSLIAPFHLFTVTLLSLLLPLSFLLLARLSSVQCALSAIPDLHPLLSSSLFSLLLFTIPALLSSVVFFISTSTLFHCFSRGSPLSSAASPQRLFVAWILLCTVQLLVGLSIEGNIALGIEKSPFDGEDSESLWVRGFFFVGLHQTMIHWARKVVKPVVNDAVFRVQREESATERVAVTVALGGLWWWKLRDEAESLVMTIEAKRKLLIGVAVTDFAGCFLYYLTAIIGIVKVLFGVAWFCKLLFSGRRVGRNATQCCAEDEDDDKV